MTDKCPKCGLWYLILDDQKNQARCLNPDCSFKYSCSRTYYVTTFADRNRMVIFPQELGGGLNPAWRNIISDEKANQ